MITRDDKNYLRDLAKKVRFIADNDIWAEKRKLWADLARLEGKRTMVMSPINGSLWRELIPPETMKISDPFFKPLEFSLKKRIFRWENLVDDTLIDANIYIPIDYKFTDWIENRKHPVPDEEDKASGKVKAAKYQPSLIEYSDLKKLRIPEIEYINMKKTDEQFSMAYDVFGDILNVNKGAPYTASRDHSIIGWGLSMIDVLCELRGLEQVYYDIYEAPEFLHEAMSLLQKGTMDYLDTMEREHLLFLNNSGYMDEDRDSETFSTGENGIGVSDELPPVGFDHSNILTKDLFGYFMEQELEPVSPEHRYEFAIQYQKPIAARFGLISYGCCENNDRSYDCLFEAFPNLRFVAVPYVSNFDLAINRLKKYVMTYRPLSTDMLVFDKEATIKWADSRLSAMKGNNAIIKISGPLTLQGKNWLLKQWNHIVVERAKYYGRTN